MIEQKISIIIPCYNVASHLSKCVESIISQTYKNFELILVNDGSSDTTGKIADEYAEKDTRIKSFHQENSGASSAKNLAIDKATSDLVLFVDGDDYVKKEYIEHLLNNYQVGKWPICGVVNIKKQAESESQNFKKLIELYPNKEIPKRNFMDLIAYNVFSSPCARVYDLKIIGKHQIRFNEKVRYQEDLLFNLNYAKHISHVTLVDYFGYCYVQYEKSSTRRFQQNLIQSESLHRELAIYIQGPEDRYILQEFLFQTAMREISNITHSKSLKNRRTKIADLNEILNSKSFEFFQSYIKNTDINYLLKCLLLHRKSYFIFQYYDLKNTSSLFQS